MNRKSIIHYAIALSMAIGAASAASASQPSMSPLPEGRTAAQCVAAPAVCQQGGVSIAQRKSGCCIQNNCTSKNYCDTVSCTCKRKPNV